MAYQYPTDFDLVLSPRTPDYSDSNVSLARRSDDPLAGYPWLYVSLLCYETAKYASLFGRGYSYSRQLYCPSAIFSMRTFLLYALGLAHDSSGYYVPVNYYEAELFSQNPGLAWNLYGAIASDAPGRLVIQDSGPYPPAWSVSGDPLSPGSPRVPPDLAAFVRWLQAFEWCLCRTASVRLPSEDHVCLASYAVAETGDFGTIGPMTNVAANGECEGTPIYAGSGDDRRQVGEAYDCTFSNGVSDAGGPASSVSDADFDVPGVVSADPSTQNGNLVDVHVEVDVVDEWRLRISQSEPLVEERSWRTYAEAEDGTDTFETTVTMGRSAVAWRTRKIEIGSPGSPRLGTLPSAEGYAYAHVPSAGDLKVRLTSAAIPPTDIVRAVPALASARLSVSCSCGFGDGSSQAASSFSSAGWGGPFYRARLPPSLYGSDRSATFTYDVEGAAVSYDSDGHPEMAVPRGPLLAEVQTRLLALLAEDRAGAMADLAQAGESPSSDEIALADRPPSVLSSLVSRIAAPGATGAGVLQGTVSDVLSWATEAADGSVTVRAAGGGGGAPMAVPGPGEVVRLASSAWTWTFTGDYDNEPGGFWNGAYDADPVWPGYQHRQALDQTGSGARFLSGGSFSVRFQVGVSLVSAVVRRTPKGAIS